MSGQQVGSRIQRGQAKRWRVKNGGQDQTSKDIIVFEVHFLPSIFLPAPKIILPPTSLHIQELIRREQRMSEESPTHFSQSAPPVHTCADRKMRDRKMKTVMPHYSHRINTTAQASRDCPARLRLRPSAGTR